MSDEKDKDEETPWKIPHYDRKKGDQLKKVDLHEEAKEENEEQERD